ncbi:DUF948 domain-containing protein [Boudabousia marimammalium]|uniref:DUF948 domain-containing protein n=1 Tax=Boudabousia marimammalium TaxID=156892 RepID=A0A1Q5PR86_9ACTO|nr:DUF948 domain-containing protein [Boudabousia marimammalium]OKL50013.1 hypothetical protein BM477_03735 [Boudabousia marimammalium]
MTWTDIASMIAAIAFVILVLALAYPLYQLGRTFRHTSESVVRLTASADATVREATTTLQAATEQIEKIDVVTTSASHTAQDISAISALVAASVGSPLIKLNAFSYSAQSLLKRQIKLADAKSQYQGRVDDLRSALIAETGSELKK